MLPVGFFMAVTLWSGNAVYLHLTVSFIQVKGVGREESSSGQAGRGRDAGCGVGRGNELCALHLTLSFIQVGRVASLAL